MSHFGDWFNYQASLKILLFSMLAGAALPGLFALGLRFHAVGAGQVTTDGNGSPAQKNPALLALAWLIYAVVLVAITFALLYISRDFIAHHTGTAFLGAKPK
ncbi:hypothetical protein A5692_06865 [Mycobacterium sp. E342]|uniref:hypothetical protein n=1 Tax=Mycobacterium sp. E342 TaxID=1834147 RepID=UPI0007FDB6DB|nr:hypothetical protein [Mycobacterium sp. E342]OBH22654.1 hypothetical protein A5692_06865 [Mycobacterium sp. E342]